MANDSLAQFSSQSRSIFKCLFVAQEPTLNDGGLQRRCTCNSSRRSPPPPSAPPSSPSPPPQHHLPGAPCAAHLTLGSEALFPCRSGTWPSTTARAPVSAPGSARAAAGHWATHLWDGVSGAAGLRICSVEEFLSVEVVKAKINTHSWILWGSAL